MLTHWSYVFLALTHRYHHLNRCWPSLLTHVCMHRWESILLWRHNERDGVSNHRRHGCLLTRLFISRSKKTSGVTGLCQGNSPITGEFPAQRASNAENISIWWRHHDPTFVFWYIMSCNARKNWKLIPWKFDKNIFETSIEIYMKFLCCWQEIRYQFCENSMKISNEILQKFIGNDTEIPLKFHRTFLKLPLQFCENHMADTLLVFLNFHRHFIEVPWRWHRISMEIQWKLYKTKIYRISI